MVFMTTRLLRAQLVDVPSEVRLAPAELARLRRCALLSALTQHHLASLLGRADLERLRATCGGLTSAYMAHAAAIVFPTLAIPMPPSSLMSRGDGGSGGLA